MSKPGGAQCRLTYLVNELTVYKKKTAPDAAYVGLERTPQTGVVTMADWLATQQLPEKEREAILEALVKYYSGGAKIADALTETEGISKSTYYNRKEQFPDEMDKLHAEARAKVLSERSGAQLAFEARILDQSYVLQEAAAQALLKLVPVLERTARGEPRIVSVGGKEKMIVPYPRDRVEATRLMMSIAKDGVMPEWLGRRRSVEAAKPPVESRVPMIPVLGISTNFSKVSATTPDGRVITATVERDGDVVDGDVAEQ